MIAVIDTTDTPNLIADPDASEVEQLNRLALAVAAMRGVLNDPQALMRRAVELLNGTARPLFVFALVGLATVRLVGGPIASAYVSFEHPRRAVAAAPAPPSFEREAA